MKRFITDLKVIFVIVVGLSLVSIMFAASCVSGLIAGAKKLSRRYD